MAVMAVMVVMVVMGTLLSGPPTASAQANTPATGAPIINGTAHASETLTVDTSEISMGPTMPLSSTNGFPTTEQQMRISLAKQAQPTS